MTRTAAILLIISLIVAIAITYGTASIFVTCFNNQTIGGWGCNYGFPVAWRSFGDALGHTFVAGFCADVFFWFIIVATILFAIRYMKNRK